MRMVTCFSSSLVSFRIESRFSCCLVSSKAYHVTYPRKRISKVLKNCNQGFLNAFRLTLRTRTIKVADESTLSMRDFSVLWHRIVTVATCILLSSSLAPSSGLAVIRSKQYGRQNFDVSKMRAARTKLPSEAAKEKKEKFLEKPLVKSTLKAVPIVLVIGGAGYIGYQTYILSEKKKIQRWQQVLQRQFQADKDQKDDLAQVPVENTKPKEEVGENRLDKLSRLELFHKKDEVKEPQLGSIPTELPTASTEPIQSLLLEYLRGKISVLEWNEGIQKLELSRQEVVEKTKEFCTKYLNSMFDKCAKSSEMNDKSRIETLLVLVDHLVKLETFSRDSSIASDLSKMEWLEYSGTATEKQIETAYRLLAIHFFSSESSIKDGMEKLPCVQRYLKINDERFHSLNQEVAKAIFQVAVSNTLSDGKLDNESREALESLKRSFTNMIDNESAENIISEVGLMRVMYALQQILKEQQFGDEDIQMLKSMCEQMGVDIASLLKTAEDMGDNMGPQVKEFVQQLRSFLAKTSKEEQL